MFKGKIDELRVWNVARTEKEVNDNMLVPMRGDHENLVALWHFDEPDGTHTAYDATINGNDCALYECNSREDKCFVESNAMKSPVAICKEGDLNCDRCVDRDDYLILISDCRDSEPNDPMHDLNGDGVVNIADARYICTLFTNPQGTPCE